VHLDKIAYHVCDCRLNHHEVDAHALPFLPVMHNPALHLDVDILILILAVDFKDKRYPGIDRQGESARLLDEAADHGNIRHGGHGTGFLVGNLDAEFQSRVLSPLSHHHTAC
jgi:hypothetical protein